MWAFYSRNAAELKMECGCTNSRSKYFQWVWRSWSHYHLKIRFELSEKSGEVSRNSILVSGCAHAFISSCWGSTGTVCPFQYLWILWDRTRVPRLHVRSSFSAKTTGGRTGMLPRRLRMCMRSLRMFSLGSSKLSSLLAALCQAWLLSRRGIFLLSSKGPSICQLRSWARTIPDPNWLSL